MFANRPPITLPLRRAPNLAHCAHLSMASQSAPETIWKRNLNWHAEEQQIMKTIKNKPGSNRQSSLFASLVLFILLATTPALAQNFKATVVGEVRDSSNAVIPGITITVIEKETGRTQAVVTSADGRFSLTNLPPGRYELRVAAPR